MNIVKFIKSLHLPADFAAQAQQSGLSLPPVSFRLDGDAGYCWDAQITRRRNGAFRVSLSSSEEDGSVLCAMQRLRWVIHCFALCPDKVESLSVNFSDGDRESKAESCFSARDPSRLLLPDPHFLHARGFAAVRALAETSRSDWDRRADTVRWRGGPNGAGAMTADMSAINDLEVMQRVRLAMHGLEIQGIDAKLVLPPGSADPFNGHGGHLVGPWIAESSWLGDKYAIDIDGHTNSWSNFLVRLHLGCCVFKIESQFGYRQWYYDRIKPWEHFVPVRADMGDLEEKIDWARSNQEKAREIARNGQEFAQTMTFESETNWAANAMTRHAKP